MTTKWKTKLKNKKYKIESECLYYDGTQVGTVLKDGQQVVFALLSSQGYYINKSVSRAVGSLIRKFPDAFLLNGSVYKKMISDATRDKVSIQDLIQGYYDNW